MQTEDTFTRPSEWCPSPERWHAMDVDSTELEVSELVAGFVRALQPRNVVETGTAWGQTAKLIGEALVQNGHGHLVTSEPDPERWQHCVDLLEGLPVTVLQQESLSVTLPGPVDFAWFDSLLQLRGPEFEHYRTWMEVGTIVGFHDTGPHKKVMMKTMARLERRRLLKPIRLRTPRGVTFAEVL